MKKSRKLRVLVLVVAAGIWAVVMYVLVVKPVAQAGQPQEACRCAAPTRAPELESDEGIEKLGPPQPGEWRHRFKEDPQSFEQYIGGPVNWACAHRKTFYIQPLGAASERYKQMLERMRVHAEAYFGVSAKVLDAIPMFEQTLNEERGQYDARRIIAQLAKRVPADALVFIGITEKDLYSQGLNFVFGEASLRQRCGIYSLVRYETDDLPLFTRRSLKLLSHESGHILSIHHCVTYSCAMQGANSLTEHDRHPMHLCPIDLQKVLWNTGIDRRERYRRLQTLYRDWNLAPEALWVAQRAAQ